MSVQSYDVLLYLNGSGEELQDGKGEVGRDGHSLLVLRLHEHSARHTELRPNLH